MKLPRLVIRKVRRYGGFPDDVKGNTIIGFRVIDARVFGTQLMFCNAELGRVSSGDFTHYAILPNWIQDRPRKRKSK